MNPKYATAAFLLAALTMGGCGGFLPMESHFHHHRSGFPPMPPIPPETDGKRVILHPDLEQKSTIVCPGDAKCPQFPMPPDF